MGKDLGIHRDVRPAKILENTASPAPPSIAERIVFGTGQFQEMDARKLVPCLKRTIRTMKAITNRYEIVCTGTMIVAFWARSAGFTPRKEGNDFAMPMPNPPTMIKETMANPRMALTSNRLQIGFSTGGFLNCVISELGGSTGGMVSGDDNFRVRKIQGTIYTLKGIWRRAGEGI